MWRLQNLLKLPGFKADTLNYGFCGGPIVLRSVLHARTWNVSFFDGHPIVLQCFSSSGPFRPLLTRLIFSCFDGGAYNHTNTNGNQLKTCVIDIHWYSWWYTLSCLPKDRPPLWLQRPRNTGLTIQGKEPPTTCVCWLAIMLNSHQLNVLHFFQEKTLQDRPFQGLTKTPRFEESKSHIEEAGTIENIWKYIHTHKIIQRSPSRACSANHPRYVSLEGDVVPARIETSREQTCFEDTHPGRISLSQYLHITKKTMALNCSPFQVNIGCHQQKRSGTVGVIIFKNLVPLSGPRMKQCGLKRAAPLVGVGTSQLDSAV